MVNKIMTLEQAVADVRDGMTIMVGGFLATGSPEIWTQDSLLEISQGKRQEVLGSFWSITWWII